jgi:predicted nucleic acid-binding protein
LKFLIDSSAWIEYLEGSLKGEKVNEILESSNEIYSISLILSEVISKSKRSNQDVGIPFRAITLNSKFVDISPDLSREAGILHAEMKKKNRDFGLVDAMIWVLAKNLNAKLVTCDFHFRNFKNVVLLK